MNEENPGYIIDIVKMIYQNTGYHLSIKFYPWSRAIKYVREGKVDAILAPTKSEVPDLLYPTNEVGVQRMCFFTKISSDWLYEDNSSLNGMAIGIAQDGGLEELNNYVKQHPEQFQVQPYLDRYLQQNIAKLKKNRIDSFLFTQNSTLYELKKLGIEETVRNAGCVAQSKVYIAFNNTGSNVNIKEMISLFDKKIIAIHKSGALAEIMIKYKLQSWKTYE